MTADAKPIGPALGPAPVATRTKPRLIRSGLKLLAYALIGTCLAAVFLAYRNPHRVVELANRVWSCV